MGREKEGILQEFIYSAPENITCTYRGFWALDTCRKTWICCQFDFGDAHFPENIAVYILEFGAGAQTCNGLSRHFSAGREGCSKLKGWIEKVQVYVIFGTSHVRIEVFGHSISAGEHVIIMNKIIETLDSRRTLISMW
jgi:hypothetical protein